VVAERFDEWADFPKDKGLVKQDAWMVQLVNKLRRVSDRVQAVEDDVASLTTDTTVLNDGSGSITFITNVANYGAGYQALRCVKTSDNMVHVSGLISNNTGAGIVTTSVIAQLPIGFRPATIAMGECLRTAGGGRVDIATNGQITVQQFTWPNADFLWIAADFEAA